VDRRGRHGVQLLAIAGLLAACGGRGETAVFVAAHAGDGWELAGIARGVKPTLALDSEGRPAVTYVQQGVGGWVDFATAADDWTSTRISTGNYAGPADLDFDDAGRPHVAWHDHELAEVNPRYGNLVHAVRTDGAWQVGKARDQGHDGFQTSIALDGPRVHAAGIEPVQYRTDQGVEHYVLEDGTWSVASIGTGPLGYEYDVSLAVARRGPALTYYDDRAEALVYAEQDDETLSWRLERVSRRDEAGEFSSLAFNAADFPHVAFSRGNGEVLLATRTDAGWKLQRVAGERFASAVSLAFHPDGRPAIAFANRDAVRLAVRTMGEWSVETIAEADRRPFGKRVSLEIDAEGTAHVAFYELTRSKPLRGVVVYAVRS
jgi:hypothetical protein